MTEKHILVTGASGYIAGLLIPRLLEDGYRVRCMVRNYEKIANRPWIGSVSVMEADVTDPASMIPALHEVDAAYYLVHNMSSGRHYQKAELNGARNFAQAAADAKIEQIIYLGGLADPKEQIAPHMRSRIETGDTLRKFPVPVTEFRAGVIAGPGSISFEMIRFIAEQFPLILGPTWLKNHSQPISAGNVIDYLIAALETPASRGRILEIGGSEIYLYIDLMRIYARIRGLKRAALLIPRLPTGVMAYFVDRLTPVPAAIAYPLINGLQSDSLVKDMTARELFPNIQLTNFPDAVRESLDQLHPDYLDQVWVSGTQDRRLKHEGFLIETYHANPSPNMESLLKFTEDTMTGYCIEQERESCLLLKKENNQWLLWEILPDGKTFRQTAYYAPKDMLGFLRSQRWRVQTRKIFRAICLK